MARGTTLKGLREKLKAELGYNLMPGQGEAQNGELNNLLDEMQQWLWSQYKFPFLYTHEDVAITAGTRYYNLPTVVSLDYPTKTEVKWGDLWYDVDYGIHGEQYEQVDPDTSETRDPVERWQEYSATQFEVWPVPATDQTLRYWGTKVVGKLLNDNDVATLDDSLIVLFTAAEKLARSKNIDAKAKLERAMLLFHRLKGANRPDTVFSLASGDSLDSVPRLQKVITVVGNPSH